MPSILVKYSGDRVELANCHKASVGVQSSDVVQEGVVHGYWPIGSGEVTALVELMKVLRR